MSGAAAGEMQSEEWSDFLPGQQIAGFRIVGDLPSDDTAITLLAEAPAAEGGVRALLLVLRGVVSSDSLASIERGRRTLRGLNHPGLARILDVGVLPDRRVYVAFAQASGTPFLDHCREQDLPERLNLFRAVCRALRYAHAQLVVHGRLRACDVVVGADSQPLVMGIGLEHVRECIDAADLEGRRLRSTAVDIRALGGVLYELLTDHAVSSNADGSVTLPSAVLARTQSGRARARRLRGDLDAIVLNALDPDPSRSYPSVETLDRDVARYLQGRTTTARNVTMWHRLGSFAARNAISLTVAGMIVVLSIVLSIQFARERDRAQEAERALRIDEETANAVSRLFVGMFKAARQDATADTKLDVRELLDRGRKTLLHDVQDDPKRRSAMLHALAEAYEGHGHWTQARELFEEAVAIRRSTNATSASLAASLAGLARILVALQQDAEPFAREAIALLEGDTDASVRDRLQAWDALGLALSNLGNFDEADVVLLDAERVSSSAFGKESKEHAAALRSLAHAAVRAVRFEVAESRLELAIPAMSHSFGRDHPDTISLMLALADVRNSRGDSRGAEVAYRNVIARHRALKRSETDALGSALEGIAAALRAQGRYREAIEANKEALDVFSRLTGSDVPRVAWTRANLGRLYLEIRDYANAEPLLRESLVAYASSVDDRHPQLARSRYLLAQLLVSTGRLAEAEPLVRKAYVDYVAAYGEEHALTALARALLGETLRLRGELDRAEAELLGARSVAELGLGVSYVRRIGQIDSSLAEIAEVRGDRGAGIVLREQVVRALLERLGSKHPEVAEARFRLAKALAALERLDDARRELILALPILDAEHPDDSPVRRAAHALLDGLKEESPRRSALSQAEQRS